MKRYSFLYKLTVFSLIFALCFTGMPCEVRAEENTDNGAVGLYESSEAVIEAITEESSTAIMPVGGWQPLETHYTDMDIKPVRRDDGIGHEKSVINSDLNSVFSKGAGHMGYDALDSEAKKTFYLRINDIAIDFMQSETDLSATSMGYGDSAYVVGTAEFSDLGLTLNDAYQAFVAYDYDHPAYYWISNSVWYTNSSIMMCTEPEYASASARAGINSQIINGVMETVALTDSVSDTLDKVLIVHDKIVTDIDYAYKSDGVTPESEKWAHSVQGVFDPSLHGAVCEGYADSFSLIMNYLNIPNYYIVGTASSSGAGGGGGHAWNAVSVDGGVTYIYMDLTWDDLGEDTGFFYEYFGMPKTDFEKTHFKYTSSGEKAKWLYDLNCILSDDFDNIYYNVSGLYYNGGDAGALAKVAKTRAHRLGNIVTFMANSLDKLRSVVSALGLSGYSYYNVSYKGTAYYIFSKRFTDKTDISGAEIIISQETYDYDGKPVEPIPTVICNGITLIRGLNYAVSYENNESSDSIAKLKVSGCGNFYGEGIKNFTIGNAVITPGPTETPSPTPEPTDVPTPMPKKELTPSDFSGIDGWKAENITDENSFLYTGQPNPVNIWSTDLDCGEITIYYKAVGSDTWISEAPVNAGKYLVAIDVEESEYCQAAEKLRADDWKMVIQPCLLRVKPDSLGKEVGDADPELTFTYSLHYGNTVGVPGFKGSLVRETGEDTGSYKILQGTLELIDNGDFLASNYMIEFFPNVTFSIYTVPLDKTEVHVVSKTKHSVVLGWSKVDNAEGYTVRLNGESTLLVTTSELTCEITGLNTGGSYLFYVRPYRRSPEYYSANETSIEVTTEPRDVPTAADFDFLTEDADYDGMPHPAVIVPKDTEIQIGHIRYANVETPTYWSFDAPVNPGTYMVDIYVQQTENYEYVYDLTDSTWRFTIKSAGGKKGDVDGDDDITPKDVTMLRRHLAGGWNVTIIEVNADVDGDGEITPKDVTILRRFLAGGWGVTLG